MCNRTVFLCSRRQKPPEYQPETDLTLTKFQAKIKGFRPNKFVGSKDDFFTRGTPLNKSSINRGYHEAAVPRELYYYLRDLKNKSPSLNSKKAVTLGITQPVNEETLTTIIKHADGFRTDTAISVLSSEKNTASGHSGSSLDTTNQSSAHKLVINGITKILQLGSETSGLTESSIVCAMASIVVSSIAPGELANSVGGGVSLIKKKELDDWEVKRNESKARIDSIFRELSPVEQTFVRKHSGEFIKSTGNKRELYEMGEESLLRSQRSTSPFRNTNRTEGTANFGGGKYIKEQEFLFPTKTLPKTISDWGLYVTEPFRAERRNTINK